MNRERKRSRQIPLTGIDARYLRYLKPYGGMLFISGILILVVATLDTLAPWPIKYIVDNVIGGEPFSGPVGEWVIAQLGTDQRVLTVALGLVLMALTVLQGLASFTYEYVIGIIQERTTFLLRSDVFRHTQRLPLQFYDESRLGDVLKRVTGDSGQVMVALIGSLGEFLVNAVKFAGFAGIMLFVNWRFSVIILAYVPLLLFLYVTFRQNIRATARKARSEEGRMMSLVLETFGAIREVKAFGRETYQQAQFEAHGMERVRASLRSIRWEASFSPVIDFAQAASTAAVIWYGVSQILVGQFSVGELLLFVSYLKEIYRPLRRFSKVMARLQKATISGERLATLLDVDAGIQDAPDARPLDRARGEISLEHVDFAYPSAPDNPVLRDVNLHVEAGQVVALVGGTGSGKSTLTSLLMRFYEAQAGRMLIDGIDLRQIRLDDLRRQFAMVPQESVLLARSIRDNIAYGQPDASDEKIVAVARAANADGFIRRLPQGYDTIVGERGGTLSGGQRQRIAIARALLRDSPILILDEPTAALDAESEDLVMGALARLMCDRTTFALARLMCDRTTFIIAHRLSTIREADLIVVMDKGHIVEQGNHTELMQRNGHYARLVCLQTGEGDHLVETASSSGVST
jgi:subfamily B ATP-binding cassette protein MsbA